MKKALAMFVASALLAAAGAAAPQAPAPASSPAQSREPAATSGIRLKLRLDEVAPSRPRITFGPRDGAGEQGSANSLPSLGPSPSRSFDRPSESASQSTSSPYPKDAEQGR